MRRLCLPGLSFGLIIFVCSCSKKTENVTPFQPDSDMSGGKLNTSYDFSSNAFGNPCSYLVDSSYTFHKKGDQIFSSSFVAAPSAINPGLGPIFNANACGSCHVNDGKGNMPVEGQAISSLLFRLSVSGTDPNGGPNPVPGFGTQLQIKAITGVTPEGQVNISYIDSIITMIDGFSITLHKPVYTFTTYENLPGGFMFSPRIAPANFGLGLLETIDEATITNNADPDDNNNDGISGKPNYVYDVASGKTVIGRFGWKANQPNLKQQAAGAFNGDMGITTSLFSVKSCFGEPQCSGYNSLSPDLSDTQLNAVTFYLQSLAVPARRNVNDTQVQKGKLVFNQAKCGSCHLPNITTGINSQSDLSYLSLQDIQPFTDLLLHDMGSTLADGRPDFLANGSEWRTSPLWGIGLLQIVNGNTAFMHDGRARSLLEAIMWHGGEGQASKEYVRKLSAEDRNALITFLQSL